MNRLTAMFLVLLIVATLSAGVLYQDTAALLAGRSAGWNWVGIAVSIPVLGFALLVLGRILYLTAPHQARGEVSR